MKNLFLQVIPKTVFMRKYSHNKWPKNFAVKFGEIWAKILRTPNFACSYTYAVYFLKNHILVKRPLEIKLKFKNWSNKTSKVCNNLVIMLGISKNLDQYFPALLWSVEDETYFVMNF